MKRQLIYTTLALSALLCSCSDWLYVQPDASIDKDRLFEREEGFYEAVNGIYMIAADVDCYGRLFSVEVLDAMMQNYSFAVSDYTKYAKTAAFDFTDINFKSRLDAIWSKAYSAIVNCNLVIENADKNKDVFQPGMYELVMGEALAMRAYIHLDMLRLFGPVHSVAPSAAAIPYVTTYSNKVTPISTSSEAIDLVIKDLRNAKTLLAVSDPILSDEYVVGYLSDDDTTEEDYENLFLQNRRHRMNYYAVCGALARACLWKGDHEEASINAMEVINSGKFTWALHEDLNAAPDGPDRDRVMYTELVFAWYNEKESDGLRRIFDNTTTGFYVNTTPADLVYETGVSGVGSEDMRLKTWFIVPQNNTNVYKILKYIQNYSQIGNKHYLVIPAIRLSEMWYIAAECAYNSIGAGNPNGAETALTYLNLVREKRGIRTVLDDQNAFISELLKEYRKETYCEGQAFLQYKRLNRDIAGESAYYEASKGIYNPPMPDSEIEYRENNK